MCVLQAFGAPVVLLTFVAGMGALRGESQKEIMDKVRRVNVTDDHYCTSLWHDKSILLFLLFCFVCKGALRRRKKLLLVDQEQKIYLKKKMQ